MRIADPNPPHCSVCLQAPSIHNPQLPHVDFEVAYDGPVVTRHGEEVRPENFAPVSIDDLIVCADCVKAAARLVGMEDGEELRGRITMLSEHAEELDRQIEEKDKMISHLEKTVGYALDNPIKRPGGKPQLVGPDSHAKDVKALRSQRVQQEKRSKAARQGAVA